MGKLWDSIPSTNDVSIYFTIVFGIATIIFVFRLWLKVTCGKFDSDVRMDGKTVLITGANSGIGKETAKDLAKRGARVIMACRTMDTANKARDEIVNESGNENVVVHHIDLSSFQSVRDFADKIIRNESKLDILIHNAGYVNYLKKAVSVDGIEFTMATNHYGPFLLSHLLIDLLKKAESARIVFVASKTHTLSFMNPLNDYHLNPTTFLIPGLLYGNSKLANILTCFEMARRLKGTTVTVNCLHPGVVDTGIWRNIPFPFSLVMDFSRLFLKNLHEGIQTVLYCALSSDIEGVSGKYFRDCKEGNPHKNAYKDKWQEVLWQKSKEIVKLTKDDPKI